MRLNMRLRPDGLRRIRTRLDALQLGAGDLQGPVLRLLDSVHNRQVKLAFASRGDSVATGPWPPWSPKYTRWRSRYRGRLGNRMMRLTDSLYEKATSPRHAGHIARWIGKGLRFAFGYADDVGFWHQQGTGTLPVRSVIDKTPEQHSEFVTAFVTFYRNRIRQVLRHSP